MDIENKEVTENVSTNQKAEHKFLFIIITFITAFIAGYCKLYSFGWLTVLLTWGAIIPAHFICFIFAGIDLALIKNKTKEEYIILIILCITMILSTSTFVDVGDTGSSKMIDFISEDKLIYIFLASFITNIIYIAKSFKIFIRKKDL